METVGLLGSLTRSLARTCAAQSTLKAHTERKRQLHETLTSTHTTLRRSSHEARKELDEARDLEDLSVER